MKTVFKKVKKLIVFTISLICMMLAIIPLGILIPLFEIIKYINDYKEPPRGDATPPKSHLRRINGPFNNGVQKEPTLAYAH